MASAKLFLSEGPNVNRPPCFTGEHYDKKKFLASGVGMDEVLRISNCKTAKEICDTLETTHKGTGEVNHSRINTLTQEYEMFRMLPREKIIDMQKRFTHLTNHLASLEKTLTNNELNLKILISLTRAWQPKVTAILENKRLENMSLAAHFWKTTREFGTCGIGTT